MNIRIANNVVEKIRLKHGLDWDDVATIFEDDEDRLDVRSGETGISYGIARSGVAVAVITLKKGDTRYVKTARRMTRTERAIFRRSKRT
jgi:hypothetical protein